MRPSLKWRQHAIWGAVFHCDRGSLLVVIARSGDPVYAVTAVALPGPDFNVDVVLAETARVAPIATGLRSLVAAKRVVASFAELWAASHVDAPSSNAPDLSDDAPATNTATVSAFTTADGRFVVVARDEFARLLQAAGDVDYVIGDPDVMN